MLSFTVIGAEFVVVAVVVVVALLLLFIEPAEKSYSNCQ